MSHAPIYIVDGTRTPFLKARNAPGPFSAADLATQAGHSLLLRQPFSPHDLDEVILGCAAPSADETNIGRVVALRLGCGHHVPGWTVMRNCASGMQALDSAISSIQRGQSSLVLAGGVDALSRAPLLVSAPMTRWLANWQTSASWRARLKALSGFPWTSLAPEIGLLKGLTDPVIGVSMGQTAENVATKFGISRTDMDAYAARSHTRALAYRNAPASHGPTIHPEISPLIDPHGKSYTEDDGIRDDSTPERLQKLRPVFDKPWGNITAGNSSQVTDGAALLLLASEAAVKRWNLRPLGRIVDTQWAGLDPAFMGLGPIHAATPLLQRHGLDLDDIDLWEINEAFAAQVLACIAAWGDEPYCRQELGTHAWGTLDMDRLNVDGGAIALGHPVGASGARIVLHLLHALHARKQRKGIAAICIGGGQGGAMLIETEAAS